MLRYQHADRKYAGGRQGRQANLKLLRHPLYPFPGRLRKNRKPRSRILYTLDTVSPVREAICRISNLSVYFMAGMGILPFLAVLGSIPCKKAKVNVQNAQTETPEYRKDTEHSDTVIPKQRNL